MTAFDDMQAWLRHGGTRPDLADDVEGRVLRRAVDAVEGSKEGTTSPRDLVPLFRHAMAAASHGGDCPSLWVPLGAHWPSRDQWQHANVTAAPEGDGLRVRREPWRPAWLPDADVIEPGAAASRGERRRPTGGQPRADPFYQRVSGRRTYATPGQRDAVRTAAISPPCSTILANLPTGSGKSAVAYTLAAMATPGESVSIVVVPTTALALDQERAFREFAARSGKPTSLDILTYHTGLSPEARTAVRARIRGGQQTILFTSPESLLGSLRAAVFDAAKHGYLKAFVVDEAHAAVAWGEEFRPEFQFLPALRNDLLERQRLGGREGFRTVLMSGTLTAEVVERLARDYGNIGGFHVVSAVALRPEIEYWNAAVSDPATREERVFDAVDNLPRPLILYATRPDDATQWESRLRDEGYRRITVVHGGTDSTQRRRALHDLRGIGGSTRVDLVVATSAFGLGVDQPDVRAVVHACMPETLDRYYQEVGRGGRDGHASTAVLIPTERDLQTARTIASDTIITVGKARNRWRAMRQDSSPAANGLRRVPVGAIPSHVRADSDLNEAWNLRTLLLFQQAGVLRLVLEQPPQRRADEDADAWDERVEREWQRLRTTRLVDLLAENVDENAFWHTVEEARQRAGGRSTRSLLRLLEALDGDRPLEDAFSEEYAIARGDIPARPDLDARVIKACGGCPRDRHVGQAPRSGFFPEPGLADVHTLPSPQLARLLDESGTLIVHEGTARRVGSKLREGLRRLSDHGLRAAVLPAEGRRQAWEALVDLPVMVLDEWEAIAIPDVPVLVDVRGDGPSGALSEIAGHAGPVIALVDADARDPDRPEWLLTDRPMTLTLEQLLEAL